MLLGEAAEPLLRLRVGIVQFGKPMATSCRSCIAWSEPKRASYARLSIIDGPKNSRIASRVHSSSRMP